MRSVLEDTYTSMFTIHPGSSKMYQDLKKDYWWSGMKDYWWYGMKKIMWDVWLNV